MAQVPVSMQVTIYPRDKSVKPYPATIVGYAWITGLKPDASPPGAQPHPEHPIVLPPVDQPPPVEEGGGAITITVKQAPSSGGWGVNTTEGWYYAPGQGQPGPKR